MPIAFDPQATTEICLEADKARPLDQRALFLCRFLTAKEFRRVRHFIVNAENAKTDELVIENLLLALAVGIISWKVGEKTGTVDQIEEILTPAEMWDLVYEYRSAISINEVDLKKSALQRLSNAGPSASPAQPAAA